MPAQSDFVIGQRYVFATLAMVVALLSFINLAGMEKAILAIVLGYKALTVAPPAKWSSDRVGQLEIPKLRFRRRRARS